MGDFYDWGMGGLKLRGLHTGTVNGFRAVGNQSQGLWFDTDNKNITITGAHLIGNKVANLQLEANPGPISVSNSSVCSGDLGMNHHRHGSFDGNLDVSSTGMAAVREKARSSSLQGIPADGRSLIGKVQESYFLHTQNTTLKNNVFQDSRSGQNVFRTYLSSGDFSHFTANFTGSGNHWYDPTSTNKFVLPNGHVTNLKGWQAAVRDDYSSTWGYTSTAAGACK